MKTQNVAKCGLIFKKNPYLILMAPFMFAKWWQFTKKKLLSYIINICFQVFKCFQSKVYNNFNFFKLKIKFRVGIFLYV